MHSPLQLEDTLLHSLLGRLSLDDVDVTLLSNADLLTNSADRGRLALHKSAQGEVVETAVGQSVSVILGSLHSCNKVALGQRAQQLVDLSARER